MKNKQTNVDTKRQQTNQDNKQRQQTNKHTSTLLVQRCLNACSGECLNADTPLASLTRPCSVCIHNGVPRTITWYGKQRLGIVCEGAWYGKHEHLPTIQDGFHLMPPMVKIRSACTVTKGMVTKGMVRLPFNAANGKNTQRLRLLAWGFPDQCTAHTVRYSFRKAIWNV